MRDVINHHFTWPGLATDFTNLVGSCDTCLRFNKLGNRPAQLVERLVLTVPFKSIAVDVVGPLPKGKGGARYILTLICFTSKWPEAVPMRTASAAEVANGLISVFSRTALPLRILSDQGTTVFMSRVCKRMCELLGVDLVHTSPYRPQTSGAVERFHSTLKPILAKASERGIDWVMLLPMALSAVRQATNRDTRFSPHELVFGKCMRDPLDILYAGWVEEAYKDVDVSKWVVSLQDGLLALHESAQIIGEKNAGK